MKRRLLIAGGALVALVAAFVAGRYSRSPQVREVVKVETKVETKTEWKDRIVEREVVKWRERVVATETVRPDGTIERRWDTNSGADVKTNLDANLSGSATAAASERQDTERVETAGRPGWRLGLGAGWDPARLALSPSVYEFRLERRLAGPVWLGAWGRTDRTGGLDLALEW